MAYIERAVSVVGVLFRVAVAELQRDRYCSGVADAVAARASFLDKGHLISSSLMADV